MLAVTEEQDGLSVNMKTEGNGPLPFRVTSLKFNDGTQVDTSNADIIVFVGPNNAGKTRTLQEMEQFLIQPQLHQSTLFVLRDLRIERELSGAQLMLWLKQHRPTLPANFPNGESIVSFNQGLAPQLQLQAVPQIWEAQGSTPFLGQFSPHLFRTLYCNQRLESNTSAQRLDVGAAPNHQMHFLVSNGSLLEDFVNAFYNAFGMNIIIDAWGNAIRTRVSRNLCQNDFASTTNNGLADPEVVQRISSVPLIDTQSDGVRSFIGILLTLLTGQFPLVLIDEPEAFLHPPQARLLGQYLAQRHRVGQVFVSTHSLDVLLGLIEKVPEKVLIVRLTRSSDITSPHVLPPESLAEISNDPLLRFSRALDGIFHQGVIVCEGDTDSHFYSLVASRNHDSASSQLRT